ncbi:MAG: hypothetical protein ABH821_06115 [archaeon]
MGFLDKLFGRKKESVVEPGEIVTVRLEGLKDWVEKESKPLKEETLRKVKSRFSDLNHSLKELNELVKEIDKVDIKQEGNLRMRKVVITSKENLVRQLTSLTLKLKPPKTDDLKDLESYCLDSAGLLQKEIQGIGKTIVYTGMLLKKEVSETGKVVRKLDETFKELKSFFDSGKKQDYLELFDLVSVLKNKNELSVSSVKKINVLDKELKDLEKGLEKNLSSLESFKKSKDFSGLSELKKEKEKLNENVSMVERKVTDLLLVVRKQLEKMFKLCKAKPFLVEKNELKLLEELLDYPLKALERDSETIYIKEIFEKTIKLINENELHLKEKEVVKRVEELRNLIDADSLKDAFSEWKKLKQELSLVEGKVKDSSVVKELLKLEKLVENNKNEIQVLGLKLEELKSLKEKSLEEANLIQPNLEEKLEKAFNRKVLIKV